MTKAKTKRKRAFGVPEVKLLITTVSLTATLGLWNLFSNAAREEVVAAQAEVVVMPTQPPPGLMLDLPPMPTVIPLEAEVAVGGEVSYPATAAEAEQVPELRAVVAPTPVVIQPQEQGPIIIQAGRGGGNSGSASSPSPVTNTGSSK